MRIRRLGAVVAAFVVAVAVPVVGASSADAAAYRYWSYWSGSTGSWTFAQRGPAGSTPPDGAVQGWRFAVTVDAASAAKPRLSAATAFQTLCGSTPAEDGRKRVALVVDFGVTGDAPSGSTTPADPLRGSCVVVPTAGTGLTVLTEGGYSIREDDDLICGLSGYPRTGCGEAVETPANTPPSPKPGSTATAGGSGSAPDGDSAAGSGAKAGSTKNPARGTASPTVPGASPSTSATSTRTPTSTATPTASSGTSAPPGDADAPLLVEGPPSPESDVSGPLPAIAGLLVLIALGLGAYVRTRRNP